MPLYSQPKWSRIQTSAQPRPPLDLRTPRSNVYHAAVRIGRRRFGLPQHFAHVQEVLLAGGAFRQRDVFPLGDEFLWRHGDPGGWVKAEPIRQLVTIRAGPRPDKKELRIAEAAVRHSAGLARWHRSRNNCQMTC